MARKTREQRMKITSKRIEGRKTNFFIRVAGELVRVIDATELKK